MTVQDKDLGWKHLTKELKKANGISIKAGILNNKAIYPKGKTPVAEVAHIQGFAKIVARAMEEMGSEIDKEMAKAYNRIFEGAKMEVAFEPVARMIKNRYRKEIKKAGLVDTGRLKDNILAAIFKDGKFIAGDRA